MAVKAICDRGIIRRVARGLYDYPGTHPKLGKLASTPEQIAKAIATSQHRKIQPTGAYAANLLGLRTQVPAKIIFLTDGPDKQIRVSKQTIQLKNRSTKMMAGAGTITGLVIQALRHIGQKQMTTQQINVLRDQSHTDHKRQLRKDIKFAPAWIADIIREIAK